MEKRGERESDTERDLRKPVKRVREGEPIFVTATAPNRHRWSSPSLEVNRCRVLAARATSATATPQIPPLFLWGFLLQIPPPTSPSFLYSLGNFLLLSFLIFQIKNILILGIAEPHGSWQNCRDDISNCTPDQPNAVQGLERIS
ncbi:uncharacterized protein LOC110266980 [Arachis ipaensis]|uniref:uncharacterized protein LOC110266980 n=1 Tax=Arachis ipaensis TaxID=130454 RepID=UPI000A2B5CC7|nr:uncharacterized protein LOC110266980 [Arachis ipaensis]